MRAPYQIAVRVKTSPRNLVARAAYARAMETPTHHAHTRRALGLVAGGAAAWIVGGLYYGASPLDAFMIGLVLIGIGMAFAAWTFAEAPLWAAAGFATAFVGILLFLGPGLGRLDRLARVGSHAFALAMLAMAAAMFLSTRRQAIVFRAGAALAVLAAVLWLVADVQEPAWQPGNVLAGAGSAWAALAPDRRA